MVIFATASVTSPSSVLIGVSSFDFSTSSFHSFFFFNDTATTEIYTLSLHDALPICRDLLSRWGVGASRRPDRRKPLGQVRRKGGRPAIGATWRRGIGAHGASRQPRAKWQHPSRDAEGEAALSGPVAMECTEPHRRRWPCALR